MANLKQIKGKIRAVGKTAQVTKAMEAVSAAKMRKAQGLALSGRAYARAAVSILARLSDSKELERHPLAQTRAVARVLYVVITSDKGLAGALNSSVLKSAYADILASGLPKERVEIIALGRKAHDFFERRGFTVLLSAPNTDLVDELLVEKVVERVTSAFSSSTTDAVKVVHQNFVSTFEQRAAVRTILPLTLKALEEVVEGIVPARGKFASEKEHSHPQSYTFEPSEDEVLKIILPRLVAVFVHHALLESQASEHSARMVAMKSASDKASELTHTLTVKFNKARQAAITREVSEIVGGMEALTY